LHRRRTKNGLQRPRGENHQRTEYRQKIQLEAKERIPSREGV
jgi:hypothetical protein